MGAGPEQHGVTSNDWEPDKVRSHPTAVGPGGIFPTVFGVLRAQRPSARIACFHDWEGFGRLFERGAPTRRASEGAGGDHRAGHRLPQGEAAAIHVHPPRPRRPRRPRSGHGTPEYDRAVAEADRLIGLVLRGPAGGGHRRHDGRPGHVRPRRQGEGHGGSTMAEIEIPWILQGPGVAPARSCPPRSTPMIPRRRSPTSSAWMSPGAGLRGPSSSRRDARPPLIGPRLDSTGIDAAICRGFTAGGDSIADNHGNQEMLSLVWCRIPFHTFGARSGKEGPPQGHSSDDSADLHRGGSRRAGMAVRLLRRHRPGPVVGEREGPLQWPAGRRGDAVLPPPARGARPACGAEKIIPSATVGEDGGFTVESHPLGSGARPGQIQHPGPVARGARPRPGARAAKPKVSTLKGKKVVVTRRDKLDPLAPDRLKGRYSDASRPLLQREVHVGSNDLGTLELELKN